MNKVRLQSVKGEVREVDGKMFVPMGIHTPGLIRWAKAGFTGKKNDRAVSIIAESFGLKRSVVFALLSGEVDYEVDGDDVVFQWPDDPNKEDK
jgi:hypothetical protein